MKKTILVLLLTVCVGSLQSKGNAQSGKEVNMSTVRVRYMINDLDSAVSFYTKYLGFAVKQEAKPNFAMLTRQSGIGAQHELWTRRRS